MRRLALALLVLWLAGCGVAGAPADSRPSSAGAPAAPTVEPTNILVASASATPAATPTADRPTPRPSQTPTPRPARATPTPTFQPVTQQIGPLRQGSPDEEGATLALTLTNVRFLPADPERQPQAGNVFVVVDLEVKNLGPATLRSLTGSEFQVRDADAARRETTLSLTSACRLYLLQELLPGGRRQYCFGFQAPAQGAIDFIYLPQLYAADGLKPGKHLAFPLRDTTQAAPAAVATPTAAATRPALVLPATGRIGPIPGLARGQQYTVEVTVHDRWIWGGDVFHPAKPGRTYIILDVEIKNLGPHSIIGLSAGDFAIHDADKNVALSGLYAPTDGCRMTTGEILPGGVRRACFGYEAPSTGPLDFVFVPAPFRRDSYKPDSASGLPVARRLTGRDSRYPP